MIKHKKIFLSNKIPLILTPITEARTATALVMVKTGSKYETKKENGLSHFLEHMFFKGTDKRPDTLSLSAELDALGGEYNAFTSKEYTGYYVKTAAGKLSNALEILGDMLSHSKFDANEIEREKGVIIEELNMYQDNPMMHIEDVLESCLYGDSPAGWDTIGTKENILSFKRSDFLRYFHRQYGARSLVLILSGAISSEDKLTAIKIFEKFPFNNWRDKVPVREKQKEPSLKIVKKKTDQINLALALRTVPIGHPQELALKILSIILGGSMSSRLFISLRERSGLAYYVKTNTEFYSDSGYLSTQAGVPKDKLIEAVKIILTEYRRLVSEDIPLEELQKAKDIIAGRLLMQLEASDEIANWYGRQAILRHYLIDPDTLKKKIDNINVYDLKQAAKMIVKNNGLNLAIIGQVSNSEEKSLRNILQL